jgi:hypothetical protein
MRFATIIYRNCQHSTSEIAYMRENSIQNEVHCKKILEISYGDPNQWDRIYMILCMNFLPVLERPVLTKWLKIL